MIYLPDNGVEEDCLNSRECMDNCKSFPETWQVNETWNTSIPPTLLETHFIALRLRKRRNEWRMEFGRRTEETILSPTIRRRVRLVGVIFGQDWTRKCSWISRICGYHPTEDLTNYLRKAPQNSLRTSFFLNSTMFCRSICPPVQVMSLAGLEVEHRRQETSSSTEGIFSALYWGTSSRDSTWLMQRM